MADAVDRLQPAIASSLGMSLSICASDLLRRHGAFVRRIRTEGGQVHILVELGVADLDGFALLPETSKALGELGITIEFMCA